MRALFFDMTAFSHSANEFHTKRVRAYPKCLFLIKNSANMKDFGPPPLLAALLLGWAAPLTLGFAPPSLPVAYRARGRLAPSVPALRCASSRYLTKGRQQRVRNKYHQTSTLNPKPYTARAEDTPPPSMSVTSVEEGKRRVLQVRKAPKTHVTLSHTHARTRARAHTHTHTHALSLLSLSRSLSLMFGFYRLWQRRARKTF